MQIRCSALPRIMQCGASKEAPEIPIEDQGLPARMGSATHGAMEKCVKEGLAAPPELSPYMHRWGLTNQKELNFLVWSGLKMWKLLHDELMLLESEAEFETTIDDIRLTGHPDILCEADGNILVVIDFKSGYLDTDYSDQLMGYVKLAWDANPAYESAKVITVWIRDGFIEADDISREDMDAWVERFREAVASDDFNPGEHCMYCKRQFECPALTTKIRAVADWIRPVGEGEEVEFVGPSEMLALRFLDVKILTKGADIFKETFKDLLEREGRKVSDGAGKILFFELGKREKIVPDKAIDTMCEELGMPVEAYEIIHHYPDLFSIPKTKYLEEVVAGVDSRKKQTKDDAWEALKNAQALRTSEVRNVKHKRGTPDPIPERS